MPELEPGAVNISYGVFPHWRGRGITRRAISLVYHWLRTQPACTTVVIRVAPDNIHSLRIPEALGFQHVEPSTSPQGEELIRFDKAIQRHTSGQPAQDARPDDAASHRL
ncbi:hypothetical protein Franean1_0047 [Parafrankia sp. EAN1pec]|nr:hypothetical protein Franean1_0047 [Frankia sp. EAN1pec]